MPSLNLVFTEEKGYVTADEAEKEGLTKKNLSGTKFRKVGGLFNPYSISI